MSPSEKQAVADAFCIKHIGLTFDALPNDVNDLEDAYDQEDVLAMCNERIAEYQSRNETDDVLPDEPNNIADIDLFELEGDDNYFDDDIM